MGEFSSNSEFHDLVYSVHENQIIALEVKTFYVAGCVIQATGKVEFEDGFSIIGVLL